MLPQSTALGSRWAVSEALSAGRASGSELRAGMQERRGKRNSRMASGEGGGDGNPQQAGAPHPTGQAGEAAEFISTLLHLFGHSVALKGAATSLLHSGRQSLTRVLGLCSQWMIFIRTTFRFILVLG